MTSKVITVNTERETQFLDITKEAGSFVEESGIDEGVLHIYSRHTTAGIIINENEAGLMEDIHRLFENLVPKGAGYLHDRIDDNAHSHLRAVLVGEGKFIPVTGGRLQLGTWQRIFLAEFDGPRRREVLLKIVR